MKNEGFEPPNIWVITPKNEGCGFPWYMNHVWETFTFGFSTALRKTCRPQVVVVPHLKRRLARWIF